MAITYLRLFPATTQFILKNGIPNVDGRLRVYYEGTDDLAGVFDVDGSQIQQPVILDNDGRAPGLFVDSARVYRLEVYGRDDDLIYTVRRMVPSGGGAGGSIGIANIISNDGSLTVERIGDTVNIEVADISSSTLVSTSTQVTNDGRFPIVYPPVDYNGTDITVSNTGRIQCNKGWYHYSANVLLGWGGAVNRVQRVRVDGPENYSLVDFNLSFPHVEMLSVSGDHEIDNDGEFIDFQVSDMVVGMTAQIVNVSVHAIEGGGAGGMTQVQSDWDQTNPASVDFIKNKPNLAPVATSGAYGDLTGTPSIPTKTSDLTNDSGFISASDAPVQDVQVNSSSVVDANGVANIDLSGYATTQDLADGLDDKQDVLTAGSNITITNNVISATASPQVQSDWTQSDSSAVDFIKHKPNLATVATSGDYNDLSNKPDLSVFVEATDLAPVATSGNYNDLSNKPTIPAAQVNSDWNASTGVAAILNKPAIPTKTSDLTNDSGFITASGAPVQDVQVNSSSVVDANGVANIDLSGKQDVLTAGSNITITNNVISATASPQVQADWAQSDSTAVDFIKNKPQNLVQDANYVHTDNNFTNADVAKLSGIAAGAQVNVQADWNESDSSSDAYVKNKPTIPVVPPMKNLIAGSGITLNDTGLGLEISSTATGSTQADWAETDPTDPSYILNKPTIPAAQVNADWNAAAGVAAILNKPAIPVVPTMKELVAGSNVSLTESSTTVTVSATNIPVVGTITL